MLFYALDTLLVSLTVSHSPNPLLSCPSRNLQVVELGRIALGKHYCYGQAEAQACHCDYCLCRWIKLILSLLNFSPVFQSKFWPCPAPSPPPPFHSSSPTSTSCSSWLACNQPGWANFSYFASYIFACFSCGRGYPHLYLVTFISSI